MTFCLLVIVLVGSCHGQTKLGSYNIDSSAVSVSGLSSGGCMATQFHVAHAKKIMGVAVLAGAPYYCAQSNMMTAVNACMTYPQNINVGDLHTYTQNAAARGTIDPLSNLSRARVYVFSGTLDTVVAPAVVKKVEEYYASYVTSRSIKSVYNVPAQHGYPTENYGGACGALNSEYINNCSYNAAYDLLNHIYSGSLQRPSSSTTASGQLILFNQSEFFKLAPPSTYGMDTAGYIYVPTACQHNAKCRLHVVFHGCNQGREKLGDKFAKNTGYNVVADLNHLIILYPQAKTTLSNPNGCWDWWGFTGAAYATKNGYQITGVQRMMDRVLGTY